MTPHENQKAEILKTQNRRGENGQPNCIQLKLVLLVNGEERKTAVVDVDPSLDVMTVLNSIVTTDQLKELQEMNSETSIEFVTIVTSTGTN
jgi:hypothetical protein